MNEKLKNLLENASTSDVWLEKVKFQQENAAWLEKSLSFSAAVRQFLYTNRLTQAELATKLGLHTQQVSKILSGKENLTLKTIAEVERALNQRFSAFGLQMTDYEWYWDNIEAEEKENVETIFAESEENTGYLQERGNLLQGELKEFSENYFEAA